MGIPRSVERILALCGTVLCLPLLLLAALLIRVTSPGPVLFKQHRVGRFGNIFELLKFRSMRVDNEGIQVTAKGDARITRVGRLLRKTKLDELPELWNVARGDLSLVGPRPEVPRYVSLQNPLWRKVLEVRPGITDPVTLMLRNEEEVLQSCEGNTERYYISKLQPYKLLGYLEYLRQRTWRTDVVVILQTIFAVIFPAGTTPPKLEKIAEMIAQRYA